MRHIRCGDDILPTLARAGLAGTLHRWVDPLCQGPLASGPRAAWRPSRAEFIALSYGSEELDQDEVLAQLEADDAVLDASGEDEVVLWFEGDLFDEAIHWYLVAELGRDARRPRRLSIVQLDGWPGVDRWRGLIDLGPEQLADAFASRRAIDAWESALARRMWEVWSGTDLEAIDRLRHDADVAAFPLLRDALRRWLEEIPAVGTGLGRTERVMLEEAGREPAPWQQLFVRSTARDERPWLGDSMWLSLAWRLALEGDPLLVLGDVVTVTDRGREVLAGEVDRVALNGYDGWHGAVRFAGRHAPFRWDRSADQLIRARD